MPKTADDSSDRKKASGQASRVRRPASHESLPARGSQQTTIEDLDLESASIQRVLFALVPQLVWNLPPLQRERAMNSLNVYAKQAALGEQQARTYYLEKGLYEHLRDLAP